MTTVTDMANHKKALVTVTKVATYTLHELYKKIHKTPLVASKRLFKLFLSGSYRLDVGDADCDIDSVLAISTECGTRESVMETFFNYWKHYDNITQLNYISQARVPLLSFYCHGVEFDVAVAMVEPDQLSLNILDMKAIDDTNVLSLGGPKHTEFILQYIRNDPLFPQALRYIREWAKARQIYGSKYGYLGGISWTLLLAQVIRHENKSVCSILHLFIMLYSQWDWMNVPVHIGNEVYTWPSFFSMAIMTPVTPLMNASSTVNMYSLSLIKKEIERVKKLFMKKQDKEDFNTWWKETVCFPVSKEVFMNRCKFHLTICWPDTPENEIVAIKWLRLSTMVHSYPYEMRSFVWPHIEKRDNHAYASMCLEPEHRKRGIINLQPVMKEWLNTFPEEYEKNQLEWNIRKRHKK